jgi:hypothetical protein
VTGSSHQPRPQTLLERLGLEGAPSFSAARVDGPAERDYTTRTSPGAGGRHGYAQPAELLIIAGLR